MTCERCEQPFQPTFTRKRGHPYCSAKCANSGKPIKGPYRKTRDGNRVRTVHRVKKEREVGRTLATSEVVHHLDENKQNNALKNLEVMSNSEHSRRHMLGNRNACHR
jgi:hypothetical protein